MASDSDSSNWWERWPVRYQAELEAFAARGAEATTLVSRRGVLILEVAWPAPHGPVRLHVGYSPLHPFFRPTVSAPDLTLERHQNPFSRTLCLLIQDSGQWNGNELAADLIAEQFPRIGDAIEARRAGDWNQAADLEEAAPDPVTTYYADAAEDVSAVFFSGDQRVPATRFGKATFRIQHRPVLKSPPAFEAVLTRVAPHKGQWLAPPFQLPQPIGEWTNVPGRWVRLEAPLPRTPDELLAMAEAELARLAGLSPATRAGLDNLSGMDLALTGIVVEEELGYGPGRMGDGWLFLATRTDVQGRRTTSLVRGHRVSSDMFSRLPVAGALRDCRVLLVGCGAIGGFAAVELARAGLGRLTIWDHDVVEPGNTVRWVLGRASWGLSKTVALHYFLAQHYPFTTVAAVHGQLGGATSNPATIGSANPVKQMREWIAEADLVVDATASTEAQQALAFHTRELGKPLVIGYATEGVAGGVVARFSPDLPACLVCVREHWRDGTLPPPPTDPSGSVLPIGCNAPTFTGGAFDLQEVSLEMVRSAIGLLAPEAYDAGAWQLATLAHRSAAGRSLPAWTASDVALHPRCDCSNSR